MLVGRQRRRCRASETDRAAGQRLLRGKVRAVDQVGDDGRHDVDPRRPVALDQWPPLRRAEPVRQHDAPAGDERSEGRDALAVDVIERQRRQHAVGRRQRQRRADRMAGVHQVGVRQQCALRRAGRSRRVHQHRPRCGLRHRSGGRCAGSGRQFEIVGGGRPDDRAGITPRDQRAQAIDEFGGREHDARSGMPQRVLDLRILREQADRRHDVAAVHRAQQDARRADTIRQHVRDDIAGQDAPRRQIGAQRARRAAQLAEGHGPAGLGRDDERRVGPRRGRHVHGVAQGPHSSN